jgi:hypothetical protein
MGIARSFPRGGGNSCDAMHSSSHWCFSDRRSWDRSRGRRRAYPSVSASSTTTWRLTETGSRWKTMAGSGRPGGWPTTGVRTAAGTGPSATTTAGSGFRTTTIGAGPRATTVAGSSTTATDGSGCPGASGPRPGSRGATAEATWAGRRSRRNTSGGLEEGSATATTSTGGSILASTSSSPTDTSSTATSTGAPFLQPATPCS